MGSSLKGKVAIITGSTSGIGLGLAQALAAEGADILLNGFGDAAEIDRLRKRLSAKHGVRVSSAHGIKGQLAYSATKAGLHGVVGTLMKEAIYHGVRCLVVHPGFTDTAMVRALGEEYINTKIVPQTWLKRLIRPEEIGNAVVFMAADPAVSGDLIMDGGWHPAGRRLSRGVGRGKPEKNV